MLEEHESVTFLKNGRKFTGLVLGCESEYFWLYVPSHDGVYLGHPSQVYEKDGVKLFEVFDWFQKVDDVIQFYYQNPEESLIQYSKDPNPMLDRLKCFKLVIPA